MFIKFFNSILILFYEKKLSYMQLKISRNFVYVSLGSFIFLMLSNVVSSSFCLNKFVDF